MIEMYGEAFKFTKELIVMSSQQPKRADGRRGRRAVPRKNNIYI